MKRFHEDYRSRSILKYTYLLGFIIFILLFGYLQSTEKCAPKLVSGFMFSIYILTGGIISFKFKLPIYGSTSSFFYIEKKDFIFRNAISNIIAIVLSFIIMVMSIKDAYQF